MLNQEQHISQVAGLLASLERSVTDAEVKGNVFFVTIAEKQHQRLKSVLERFIVRNVVASSSYISHKLFF